MEQALGHATHYKNFREATERQSDISPVWLPIEFEASGPARFVPLFRSNWSVRASWRARRALNAARASGGLEAVLFHTQTTSLFSVSLMRQIPSVISLDATPINYDSLAQHYGHRPAGDSFVDRQKYELVRRAFHAADGLVTWSQWARRSLIDDYGVDGSRVRVHPPGVPGTYFDIGRARQEQSPDDGRPIQLLFVGGDFERKGGNYLLDVMRGPPGERCVLHVVTRSDIRGAPNVVVHRDVAANSPAMRRLYADADVFVFPTLADCLGVVLEEAAAAGLPVITTDVGGVGESVEPGESGLLVPPGDGRALELAVTTLVEDRGRRLRMGRAAHGLAVRGFDAHANNRAVLDFLLEAVQSRAVARQRLVSSRQPNGPNRALPRTD
jgi:glycosyltransferase involved in cell wall biosynthesis